MQGGLGVRLRSRATDFTITTLMADVRDWLLARPTTVALAFAIVAGAAIRAFYVMRESFPVNDGGMFYIMARDLQESHFILPDFTTYNGGEIPYVYSPLMLYAAALGDLLTPASLMDMFWLLPLIGSIVTLWAFARFADALFHDGWTVAIATLAFAFAPRSFIWLIMGGGLPRGIGLAFALLAMREAYLLTTGEYSRRRVVLVAVFCALTVLTHLETASFLAVTLLLIALVRPRVGLPRVAVAGVAGALLAAPWVLSMVVWHGVDPFLSAMDQGGRLLNDGQISNRWAISFLENPVHTSEPYFPLIGALGVIGGLYAFARGQWFVPAWWILTGLLGMRAFPTYVTIAACLLAGVTVGQLILPTMQRHWERRPSNVQVAMAASATAFCLWFVGVGVLSTREGEIGMYMESLSPADRTAMEWVDRNMPDDAAFAVMPVDVWPGDYPGEWFPALADRVSLSTPQGYEWVTGEFADRTELHDELLGCRYATYLCVRSALIGTDIEYLYVSNGCCNALVRSLTLSPYFEVVYDRGTNGPTILRLVNSQPYSSGDRDGASTGPQRTQ